MSDIRQIRDWRAPTTMGTMYERLLGAIGTEEFGSTVRDSVLAVTAGARRIYLFEATGREDHSLQYYSCEPGVADLFPAYNKWYVRLDPVFDAYRAAPECSNVAMLRIGPSDIASRGFRQRFFDDAGIVERVSIIQRGADSWRVINVARHENEGCFGDDELDALVGLACLALPMLPLNRRRQASPQQLTVAQFEERFASRFDQLTQRERQVCARAAIGMTVEATALDLGIAKTSVLTYRQRAYQRLRVTSPFELCSLVTH
ncbi:putative LuxR family transcriptional regulator [Sphingobium sp. SYK-6]|uniref:helix-turn-helix transcriptional regulator n=1 Tax=Sphingobium sp. (strain NBRC 103272 / SYK-6) TaxID=627192 RepID=UPI0002277559|nr:helix-turn-helix transcriptional regulator [Sphingobium sp. SYK-6]BAK66109.1 putative LuxR family transcriptional regulator [Sphingobium sp. SYK-6]